MQKKWTKCVLFSFAVLGVLAACEKHDVTAAQAAGAISNVASQAGQKFDQAANYVGQQADSVKQTAQQNLQSGTTMPDITASSVEGTARANIDGAASSTNAAIVNAASDAGAGLHAAGRRLQLWAASDPSVGQAPNTNVTGTNSSIPTGNPADPANARTDMDK
jgi:hypothetical protein